MNLGLGSTRQPPSTDTKVLNDLLEHVPLSLLVELVEHRYRDRRNRFVITILTAALSLCGASAGLLYQMYRDLPEAAEAVVDIERQQEYNERRERALTRQQFARTAQSFGVINGSLELQQPQPVQLGTGQRHHYSLNLVQEGGYRISMTNRRASSDSETPEVPFTPVMYLYRLRDGEPIARPVGTNIGGLFFDFDYDATTPPPRDEDDAAPRENESGAWSYFLEVESLLGDAGSFTLTLETS